MIWAILITALVIAGAIFVQQLVGVFEEPGTFKLLVAGFLVLYIIAAIALKALLPPIPDTSIPRIESFGQGLQEETSILPFPDFGGAINALFSFFR